MKNLKAGNKPFNLILLGDPGSGKATQTAYLVEEYSMFDFDMGEELSKLRQSDTKINNLCKKTIDQGKLAPTSLVQKIFLNTILKIPKSKGIVFDGTPRMVPEAKLLIKILNQSRRADPLVVYMNVKHTEMLKRLKNRKGYKNNHGQKRADDNHKAILNRVKYYKTEVAKTQEFFTKHYSFANVDANANKRVVKARLKKVINHYLDSYKDLQKSKTTLYFNDKIH